MSEITTLVVPETKDLQSRSSEILEHSKQVVVTNDDENSVASIYLRTIKTFQAEVAGRFEPAKKAAHEAHRLIIEMEMEHQKPLREAESIIKKVISAYMIQAEMKRQKQQEREIAKAIKKGSDEIKVIEAAPKPEGIAMRETWSAQVIDLRALVAAVARNEAPLEMLVPNQKALDQLARALKGEMNVPGVKAIKSATVAARTIR